MGDSSTLSFRVDDEVIDALDSLTGDSAASRSAIARDALLTGLEHMDGVPDHVAHDAEVRRMIARNKATRREGKFRSEFNKQVKRSFTGDNCEHPEEFKQSVAGYIEEAGKLGEIPEGVRHEIKQEHGIDVETWAEWVEWMVEEYYPAHYHAQNFDGEHVSDPLGNLTGIENAHDWMARAEGIASVDGDPNGGTREEKQQQMARLALKDGVVPESVRDQLPDDQKAAAAELVDVAENVTENRQIASEESDTTELTD